MAGVPDQRPDAEFVTRAIAAHGLWKYRLHEAIRNGGGDYGVETVRADDRCQLGQWLRGAKIGSHSAAMSAERLRSLHAEFHGLAADVLELAVAGRTDEARRGLGPGSPLLMISTQLVTLLERWRTTLLDGPASLDGPAAPAERAPAHAPASTPATASAVAEIIGVSLETSAQADVATAATNSVESSIETVASAAEQLTATISEIAASASSAVESMAGAVDSAETFTSDVVALTTTVSEIERLLSLISGIARQTNLLALNAAIEAARAGEAGRGFAVVANEVKGLASQTTSAAEDVARQVTVIQSQVERTLGKMAEFSTRIQSSQETQTVIASAVEQQRATTAEISRSVAETAMASREIAELVAAIGLAAANVSASSRRLTHPGSDLP